MKNAILTRDVDGGNYRLGKGTKVWVCQSDKYQALVRLRKNDTIEYPVSTEALKLIKGVQVDIHVKRKPYRNDAMFYYGKHIATVSNAKRTLIVESAGEMEAAFSSTGNLYANEKLAKQLVAHGITDKKLGALGMEDLIRMNNWFRIIDADSDEEMGIMHNHDDAIAYAKQILKK